MPDLLKLFFAACAGIYIVLISNALFGETTGTFMAMFIGLPVLGIIGIGISKISIKRALQRAQENESSS